MQSNTHSQWHSRRLLPLGCVLFLFPAVDGLAAEYIREEHPVTPTVQPAVGGLDHAFDAAPKRPDSFLGSLSEHLKANIRAYDYRQDKESNEENMASVIGGSLSYHTGHWRDRLSDARPLSSVIRSRRRQSLRLGAYHLRRLCAYDEHVE